VRLREAENKFGGLPIAGGFDHYRRDVALVAVRIIDAIGPSKVE
jgi:hypothetical protein